MKVVIETDEQYKNMFIGIAEAISAKISFEEKDIWDELPEHVKAGVLLSQEQFKEGKFSTFKVVKDDILSRKHRK